MILETSEHIKFHVPFTGNDWTKHTFDDSRKRCSKYDLSFHGGDVNLFR